MQSLKYPMNLLHSKHVAQISKKPFGFLRPLGVKITYSCVVYFYYTWYSSELGNEKYGI
jgi:hypothetical protein